MAVDLVALDVGAVDADGLEVAAWSGCRPLASMWNARQTRRLVRHERASILELVTPESALGGDPPDPGA